MSTSERSLSPENFHKLTEIFRTIFSDPSLTLFEEMTATDVEGWDSFNYINLVMSIEEEFNVRFSTDEVSALQKVGDLMDILDAKLV